MKTIAYSPTRPKSPMTAPYRFTVSETGTGYATHIENMESGGKSSGNYFGSLEAATKDFAERVLDDVEKYGAMVAA